MKDALALALVHFLWQGALLACVAAVLMRVVHGSAQARYAIGVATLCAMAAAPVVTAAWLIQTEPVTVVPEQRVAAPAGAIPIATTGGQPVAATDANPSGPTGTPVFRYATAVLAFWTVGVLFLSARLTGGWFIAHRLATRAVRPVVDELQQTARRLAAQLRLSRPVRILESASVAVPVMVGWLKPVVLLPAAAIAGLPADQLEALLAHELAHVRRHDYLVNLLQSTVETMLFYHPGVWWVSSQVRAEREHCCDDLAISVTERVTYVTALTHVASLTAPGLALAATDGSLRGRVRRLLGPERERPSGGAWLAALPVVLVIAVATPMSGTTEEVVRLGSQLEAVIQSAQDSQTPSAIGEATDVRAALPPERGSAATPERVPEQVAPESSTPKANVVQADGTAGLMGPQAEQRGAGGEKGALDDLRSLLAADRGTQNQLIAQQSAIRAQLGVQRANTARVREMVAKGLATADVLSRAERGEEMMAATLASLEEQIGAVQTRIAMRQSRIDGIVGVAPASEPQAPAQVKPGETIIINVERRPELSGEYVVQADGTIKLKGIQAEVIQVQVSGAVRAPGVIRLQGSDRRLGWAIALAGGFAVNAGNEVEIIRRGVDGTITKTVVAREQLDTFEDPSLQNGDRVQVKPAPMFFVNGEVARQGAQRWEPGMSVGKALALAGGPTVTFSLSRARIERPVKDKDGAVLKYEKIVNLKMETLILPDDVFVAGRR